MFITILNVLAALIGVCLYGVYLGCNLDIVNLLDVASWEEFLMMRDIIIKYDNTSQVVVGMIVLIIVSTMIINGINFVIKNI